MTRRWLALASAIVLLDVSLTFENIWPTPAVRWIGGLSIELAALLLIVAATHAWSRRAISRLSVLWTVLVVGRYADVTAPALYGRDIHLYWDLRFMPDVAAMVTRVTPLWVIVVAAAAVALAVFLIYRAVRWAWATVNAAMAQDSARRGLVAAALLVVAGFAVDRFTHATQSWVFQADEYQDDARRLFPAPVTATYAHQVRLFVDALSPAAGLAATPPLDSDFSRVKNADVFVIFVESYGAAAYERPAIASALEPSRAQLLAAIHDTRREVVSAYVDSPTYGGTSWLAHVSLLSGLDVRDAGTHARLLTERRDTLVRAFARQGFRTVALMPGLRGPWPEGAFYGFDAIYGADRLAYEGPEFGWFAVPDQFSLDRLDALEVNRASRPPLFVFFPTISPHFPFSPTPPYQPDWRRLSTAQAYDAPAIVRAYEREPDWENFTPGYIDAVAYDLASIGGYLRLHAERDLVMIVIGDHQPPALVSGRGASWSVPVHVITRRADVADRFLTYGFRKGLTPARPALGRMHAIVPVVLDAFGNRHGHPQPDNVRSKSLP